MMIIQLFLGVVIYLSLLVLVSLFFKGATRLGNEFDENMEVNRIISKLKNETEIKKN